MSTTRYAVTPEVAGGFGEHAELDTSVRPPRVLRFHFEFGPACFADDLLENYPCFMVSEELAQAMGAVPLTGFELAAVEVTLSAEFEDAPLPRVLPRYLWLKVGHDQQADLALSPAHVLCVSARALEVMKKFQIDHAEVEVVKPAC